MNFLSFLSFQSESSYHFCTTYCIMFIFTILISFAAIPPPISLGETNYSQPATYTSADEGDRVVEYSVHSGAQFGLECSSIATESEEFPGIVTWYRKTTDGTFAAYESKRVMVVVVLSMKQVSGAADSCYGNGNKLLLPGFSSFVIT